MRGNKQVPRRVLKPDPIYESLLITRLINRVMHDGKKSVAEKQVYGAFEILKKKDQNPLEVFEKALSNISPQMEVKTRRIGGAAYQVPIAVSNERRTSLGLRWLIFEARKRPNKEYKTFAEKLAAEMLDAIVGEGGAVKRREVVHKMAEANRAFSHFRW